MISSCPWSTCVYRRSHWPKCVHPSRHHIRFLQPSIKPCSCQSYSHVVISMGKCMLSPPRRRPSHDLLLHRTLDCQNPIPVSRIYPGIRLDDVRYDQLFGAETSDILIQGRRSGTQSSYPIPLTPKTPFQVCCEYHILSTYPASTGLQSLCAFLFCPKHCRAGHSASIMLSGRELL